MEILNIRGIITLHKIPDEWSDEDFRYWWCPETDKVGHIVREARISDESKAQRIVLRAENLLTNAGITALLHNTSVANQGEQEPITQILSVGNGTITGVTRADTAVAGDGFTTGARKAPASQSQSGFLSTIITNWGTGDAVGSLTNIGFYGYNTNTSQAATTTAGTGALMTHALFNFVKGSTAYAVQYVFLLSN
jgi:hypothetical protein